MNNPCQKSAAWQRTLTERELHEEIKMGLGHLPRRADVTALLCLLAIVQLLRRRDTGRERRALLWCSRNACMSATSDILQNLYAADGDGEILPFDFLRSQPAFLAHTLQAAVPELSMVSFFPTMAEDGLPTLEPIAQCWLAEGRYTQIVLAQVEPGVARADSTSPSHRVSAWLLENPV